MENYVSAEAWPKNPSKRHLSIAADQKLEQIDSHTSITESSAAERMPIFLFRTDEVRACQCFDGFFFVIYGKRNAQR